MVEKKEPVRTGRSRKSKAAWQGSVLIGIMAGLAHHFGIDPEMLQVAIVGVAGLFGIQIHGIAREDAAEKSNGGGK